MSVGNKGAVGESKPSLVVLGVYTASEGYPNTLYRIQGLRETFSLTEVSMPMWPSHERSGLWSAANPLLGAARALRAHVSIVVRYLMLPRPSRAYVPYPAVFVLLSLSFMPGWMRPGRVVADAFISVYDTIVNDRKLLPADSWRARLLKWAERRAYGVADKVVVDTAQNAAFYAGLFQMPESRFIPIALSTNEADYLPVPYRRSASGCRVLFIGTLVPLQGVDTILAAAAQLSHRHDIRFRIIGEGQDSKFIRARVGSGLANVEWEQRWQSPQALATEIAEADICLGIFGSGDKAQRVCPFKLYAYASVGRAVVTGDTTWLRSASVEYGENPFSAVPVGDADALSERIESLADNPALRTELAKRSRAFYAAMLDNRHALAELNACLMGESSDGSNAGAKGVPSQA